MYNEYESEFIINENLLYEILSRTPDCHEDAGASKLSVQDLPLFFLLLLRICLCAPGDRKRGRVFIGDRFAKSEQEKVYATG